MFPCFKKEKYSEKEYRHTAEKMNRSMESSFLVVPFSERLIFVPQCLRNISRCKAKECGSYYICMECGGCKVGTLTAKAGALGYKGLYILKGGRTVEKLLKELKPKAILGIACYFEGVQGFKEGQKHGVIVQFSPLTTDGCVNTDLNLEETIKVIEKTTATT